jgi:hypothetical protein
VIKFQYCIHERKEKGLSQRLSSIRTTLRYHEVVTTAALLLLRAQLYGVVTAACGCAHCVTMAVWFHKSTQFHCCCCYCCRLITWHSIDSTGGVLQLLLICLLQQLCARKVVMVEKSVSVCASRHARLNSHHNSYCDCYYHCFRA